MGANLSYNQKSDRGCVRDKNEDSLDVREWAESTLFIIADGLGGMDQGEIASRESVAEMKKVFEAAAFLTNPRVLLREYFQRVNAKILDMNERISPLQMATTLTISFFHNAHVWIGHVGDCRIYRIRQNDIQCLTRDHSSSRNALTRVIGTDPGMEPDIYEHATAPRDIYIQCSDGFYTVIREKEMADSAAVCMPQEYCEKLVALANERGGPDNISLQAIRIS